jgi:hypothetical protein
MGGMRSLNAFFGTTANSLSERPILYHGSPQALSVLEPRPAPTVSGLEGDFVYATSDINAAHAYALKNDDCSFVRLTPGFNHLHMCLFADRPERSRYDMEGFIYRPVDAAYSSFMHSPGKDGVALNEWISRVPVAVEPHKKVSLESAMRQGVQAFFITPDASPYVAEEIWTDDAVSFKDSKLAYYVDRGVIHWENQQAGLDPNAHPEFFQRTRENIEYKVVSPVVRSTLKS